MQPVDETYGDFVGTDMWNSKNTISEDCLYLNVWSPAVDKVDDEQAAPPAALKAVMVKHRAGAAAATYMTSVNLKTAMSNLYSYFRTQWKAELSVVIFSLIACKTGGILRR